jgi:hypothetical protein
MPVCGVEKQMKADTSSSANAKADVADGFAAEALF